MARNDVYLNINALSPADAVVTGQQDMTAATVPELVLGDTPTFNFYFTDNTNVWPSWAGNASYSLTWALSDAVAGDFAPAATTGNATPITGGWSVILPLNSYDLVGLLNTKRVGQPYPVTNLWQQLRVTDPSGNEITRAMFWTPVRYRAISDTQNTESASPTGGRFVTVNNVNTLTTPTAAQFYAANPVPTSALGTAANGELLIGNGTGFTKSTLTAGTGITVTNGSGSITIDASGAQETLTATVKNAESVAITKGQVVYLFGATGGFASVKLAYNTSDATSAKTFGVVSSTSIAANGTGTVTCVGVVDGLNLGAYNDGDTLYLGATPGSVTATKPYAPNHLVYVGIVERANNGNGELYVRVQNGYELDEIHDVQINAPKLAGQTLIYDQTNDLWKNARLTGTANQITVTNADSAVTLSIPTNPTLPGNLTVSGTGTSTFGGNLTVSGTTILSNGGSTSGGIDLLVNPTTKTSGSLIDLQINSTSKFRVSSAGDITTSGGIAAGANIQTTGQITAGVGGGFNNPSWLIYQAATPGQLYIRDTVNGVMTAYFTAGTGVTGAMNLNGNLTVSGTGTSSFGSGVNLLSIIPSTGICSFYSTQATPSFVIGNTSAINKYGQIQWIDSVSQLSIGTQSQYGTGALNIATNGNVLLGTTTNSGNGKLQLATGAADKTSGIGFSSDTSLYRYQGGGIALDHLGGSLPALSFLTNGAIRFSVYANGTTGTLETSNGSIQLATSGAIALTIDSNQNATFANGLVAGKTSSVNTITGGDAGAGTSIISFKDGLGATKVNITGDGKVVLSNTAASTSTTTGALTVSGGVGVAGAVNVGGAIAIGNTVQTAASVASTHKVTVVIGGVTYYLLATNI